MVQREDDREEVIQTRFRVYREETEPLIDSYSLAQDYIAIDGNQKPQAVFEEISARLGEMDQGRGDSAMRPEQRPL